MNATPLVLLYNLRGEKGSRIKLLCMQLRARVRVVSPEDYGCTLKTLSEGGKAAPDAAPVEPFNDEMLLFVNFTPELLNRFLKRGREMGIPGVALKAVLTPTNAQWNSCALREELQKEHQAMRAGASVHPKQNE